MTFIIHMQRYWIILGHAPCLLFIICTRKNASVNKNDILNLLLHCCWENVSLCRFCSCRLAFYNHFILGYKAVPEHYQSHLAVSGSNLGEIKSCWQQLQAALGSGPSKLPRACYEYKQGHRIVWHNLSHQIYNQTANLYNCFTPQPSLIEQ